MNRNVPWSIFNISKLLTTAALIILTLVDLGSAINRQNDIKMFPVDFYTPVIKIASFVSKCRFLFVIILELYYHT